MLNLDQITGNVLLVDPASPEVNRGSFCYLSYLLHAGLKPTVPNVLNENKVYLLEEFKVSDFDTIEWDNWDHVLIALWSYPQIETALMLQRFLKGKAYFYGYYPLIEHLGLPKATFSENLLKNGMIMYPKLLCLDAYQYILLSDCDKHIKDSSKREVSGINQKMIPMFTSYGCPMGCTFCSATVNCNKKRTTLPLELVIQNLNVLELHGKCTVHFTDEDFFFDAARAAEILLSAYHICKDFEFIALGGLETVTQFCNYVEQKYTPEIQDKIWHCLRLIEVGFETADPALAKAMRKPGHKGPQKAILLRKKARCPVLWLTVTFYPGETIASLNATGAFLAEHGFKPDQMEERIVTNGTEGGLGQFFQYYHGTGINEDEYFVNGCVLTERPMRLIPSYIPDSFSSDWFTIDIDEYERRRKDVYFWFSVYGVTFPKILSEALEEDYEIEDAYLVVDCITDTSPTHMWEMPIVQASNNAIAIAILARLNILKAVN